jgi:hypothetical protein
MNVRNLLTDARNLALDSGKPISAALQRLLALGSAPELAEIREWASRELKGYRDDGAAVPNYRRISVDLRGAFYNGAREVPDRPFEIFGSGEHSEETVLEISNRLTTLYLVQPVDEIDEMLTEARRTGRIERVVPSAMLGYLRPVGYPFYCRSAQQVAQPAALAGVLGIIRTITVEFTSGALEALPTTSEETHDGLAREHAAITQQFQNCIIGATTMSVVPITSAHSVTTNTGATNQGVVSIQNNHADSLALEIVAGELRVLAGAVTALSDSTTDSLASLLQAITDFEAHANEQGQKTDKKVDELVAILDPIWLKFMGESFKTWAQRAVEQAGGKVIGVLPGLVRVMGGKA